MLNATSASAMCMKDRTLCHAQQQQQGGSGSELAVPELRPCSRSTEQQRRSGSRDSAAELTPCSTRHRDTELLLSVPGFDESPQQDLRGHRAALKAGPWLRLRARGKDLYGGLYGRTVRSQPRASGGVAHRTPLSRPEAR